MIQARGFKLGIVIVALGSLLTTSAYGVSSQVGASSSDLSRARTTALACTQKAGAIVTAAEKPLRPNVPRTPVIMKKNAGKTIWYISATMTVPIQTQAAAAFKVAAAAAGMKGEVYDGQGTVTGWNEGVSTAVAQHAAGIVLGAINPTLVSVPLAAALAAHIPVVDDMNGGPADPLHGLFAHVTVNWLQDGKTMAAYALQATHCKSNIIGFTSSTYRAYNLLTAGANQTMRSLCPSCKPITWINGSFTTAATTIPQQLSGALGRDSGANFIISVADYFVPFMVPAEKQASKHVPIIGHDGATPNLDLIRAGDLQVATILDAPFATIGWAAADALGRALQHQSAVSETVPTRLITRANISANDSSRSLFPNFTKYQAEYKRIWGR